MFQLITRHALSNNPTRTCVLMMLSLPLKNIKSTTVQCGLTSYLAKINKMNKLLELVSSCWLTWRWVMCVVTIVKKVGRVAHRLSMLRRSTYIHHHMTNLFFLILYYSTMFSSSSPPHPPLWVLNLRCYPQDLTSCLKTTSNARGSAH